MKMVHKNSFRIINLTVGILVYLFLYQLVPLEELLANTIMTGGDTASHHQTASYLKQSLLTQDQIIGWDPGAYGGYPLFIMYFPILFLSAAGLSEWIPLTVAMKLMTLSGPFLLPICIYWMGLMMRLRAPAPSLMMLSSLLFLMNQSNSMWGGNLLSTLAGEFSYGFSFALTFAFLGGLYRLSQDLVAHRPINFWLLNLQILLLTFIGLSHGFTVIICVLACLWLFRCRAHTLQHLLMAICIFGTAGFLFSGWFVQLFFGMPYTTAFNIIWSFNDLSEILPNTLLPTALLFIATSLLILCRPQYSLSISLAPAFGFIWLLLFIIVLAFFTSEIHHLPDIRFIPFAQLLVTIGGAASLGLVISQHRNAPFYVLSVTLMTFIWLGHLPQQADRWMTQNFKGFEGTAQWPLLQTINLSLIGSSADPRVAYEHHMMNQQFGSLRAFESLPLLSGRSTLEGLYFQSSLLSPFVFYAQSLYSEQGSCPFPDYPCTRTDLARAHPYFELMNVGQFIAVSDKVKTQLRSLPQLYELQHSFLKSNYEIWRIKTANPSYVQVLSHPPTYQEPEGFRHKFYQWFRDYDGSQALIYTAPTTFAKIYSINQLPMPYPLKIESSTKPCKVIEFVEKQQISFKTNCPGRPHLIKMTYHPGWQVQGGIGPYLATPAFILIWPTQEEVVMRFNNQGPRTIGLAMSFLGAVMLSVLLVMTFRNNLRLNWPQWSRNQSLNNSVHRLLILLVVLIAGWLLWQLSKPNFQSALANAQQSYNLALSAEQGSMLRQEQLQQAQQLFTDLAKNHGESLFKDRIYFHLAMSYFLLGEPEKALPIFAKVLDNQDSNYLAEAHYHLGLCAMAQAKWDVAAQNFVIIIDKLADPYWSPHAKARLNEISENEHQTLDLKQHD